ncbi:MAG: ATP-binding cassette domain-containing protein, partial [Spartobacteria bacterium]
MPENAKDGFDSAVVEKTNSIDPEIKHESLLLWGCPPIYNKAWPAREGGIWALMICACWSFAASAGSRDVLTIRNLTKSYGSLRALDDVSLTLEPGEFFGLLGPNGAGKTTLMSLVTGIRPADSGEIFLEGEKFQHERIEQRAQLGFVPQALALYEELSGEENLR